MPSSQARARLTTLGHADLAADTVLDALRRAGMEVSPAQASTLVVLDTFDGRLHQAGLRLEHRRRSTMILELSDATGAPPARLEGATAPRWPSGLPSGPMQERLASVTSDRALLPQLVLDSEVCVGVRRDRRGKAVVAAELHEAVRVDGEHVPTWFLELRTVVGHDSEAERILTRLQALGLVPVGQDLPASVAAIVGRSLAGQSSSPTVSLLADQPASSAFAAVLGNLAGTVEANRPGTIDSLDIEFLHELRVAVRRTRSVLAAGKGVLPEDVRRDQQVAFRILGQATGPARDLDVYVADWDAQVAPLEPLDPGFDRVRQEIETRRRRAHAALRTVLTDEEVVRHLVDWQRWLVEWSPDVEGAEAIGPVVARRVTRAQAKVLRDGRRITIDSPAERLHDLRKDAKRLRYLLECFGSLLPDRKPFVAQLKDLQDNLGAHQDAEVHLAHLRELARDLHGRSVVDSDTLLAMGRLSDQLERRRAHERAAFATRFARYDRKRNRRALERMLREIEKG